MRFYYFTSRTDNDQVMFLERTEDIEFRNMQAQAQVEFGEMIAALDFLGIRYQVITEDSFNGDVLLYGDENELREA